MRGFLASAAIAWVVVGTLDATGASAAEAQTPAPRPNIVFFLVDDMGWMDTTAYGSRYYDTPNMERLARRGMLFTDAYSASPLCSPTRASIMTGKYPARLGITTPVCHLPPDPNWTQYPASGPPTYKVLCPNSRRFLPLEEYTLAEALRDGGYRTGHFGKWHLGVTAPHWPEQQGFEVAIHGKPDPGPPSYLSPYGFKDGTLKDGPPGEYLTDRLTDEALQFIAANRDRPFFCNLWHHGVHGPWGHKEELTKKYLDRTDPRGKQDNAVMCSMLKSVDESLGRVLDKLEELKLADRTIVIFTSDNGGNNHSPIEKRMNKAGLARLEHYTRYADSKPPTNNDPLREGKGSIWEGGSRVPWIICWPGVVRPESRCTTVVSSVDFYPTILEMVGLARNPQQLIDGESIVPLLKGTGGLQRTAIFCHFPHSFGRRSPAASYVRQGDWKLVRNYDTTIFTSPCYLYNLKDDQGETRDLSQERPDKVRELGTLLDQFVKNTGAVLPIPNPAYDTKKAALAGWVDKTNSAVLEGGDLHLDLSDRNAFIANASLDLQGPAVFEIRVQSSAGGPGRISWRTADQKEFAPQNVVEFDQPGDGQWHEIHVRLPVQGTLQHVRLYPASGPGKVTIARIKLLDVDGTPVGEWKFGK